MMMKFACMLVAAGCALAANAETDYQKSLVRIPGKGRIAFVNAAGVSQSALELAATKIGSQLMISNVVLKGTWTLPSAGEAFARTRSAVAVFVVRDAALPPSLVALERKWGVVNAEGLSDAALTKESMRVAAILLGCGYSKYPASVMRPVFTPEAIADGTGAIVTIDALMAIQPSLAALGIVPYRVIHYEDALYENIAPPPANDVQRKIRDEFEKNKDK